MLWIKQCPRMPAPALSCCDVWLQTRIQMRVPEYGWTTQKVFHLLNFLVAGLRAAVFASWDKVRRRNSLQIASINHVLSAVSGICDDHHRAVQWVQPFLSVYTLEKVGIIKTRVEFSSNRHLHSTCHSRLTCSCFRGKRGALQPLRPTSTRDYVDLVQSALTLERFLPFCRFRVGRRRSCGLCCWICRGCSSSPRTHCWCSSGLKFTTRHGACPPAPCALSSLPPTSSSTPSRFDRSHYRPPFRPLCMPCSHPTGLMQHCDMR